MERIEIETNRGTSGVVFESTPGGLIICNIPLIGTVTVTWKSIHAITDRLIALRAEFETHEATGFSNTAKSKKTKKR